MFPYSQPRVKQITASRLPRCMTDLLDKIESSPIVVPLLGMLSRLPTQEVCLSRRKGLPSLEIAVRGWVSKRIG